MNNQTAIEKMAEEYAEANVSYGNAKSAVKQIADGYQAGAAAVIDLIRERMPGEATAPPDYSKDIWYANGGWNFYRSEILKLLDTLK